MTSGRREMSSYLVNNVIENTTCIPTSERVDTILTIVSTLVQVSKYFIFKSYMIHCTETYRLRHDSFLLKVGGLEMTNNPRYPTNF